MGYYFEDKAKEMIDIYDDLGLSTKDILKKLLQNY